MKVRQNASRHTPGYRDEECLPITLDQLQLANKVGHAATTGGMVRKSFKGKFEEDIAAGKLKPGKYLIPSDLKVNHAAMAMLDLFPEKTPEADKLRHAVLWRAIFASGRVFADPRAQEYFSETKGQQWIGWPLLEAVATTPMRFDQEIPVDAIFANADKLAKENAWDRNTEPFE